MAVPGSVDVLAQNIQLAVAPVFLLAGVGSILNVVAARLGRVVDRARLLEAELAGYDPERRAAATAELATLGRRIAAAHWAIILCAGSALFVCVTVALLFLGELLGIRVVGTVAALFVGSMTLLTGGLLLFLVELQIATRSVMVRAGLAEKT